MQIIITTVAKKTVPTVETLFVVGMDGKIVGGITLFGIEQIIEVKTTVIGVLEDAPEAPFANELTAEELGLPCPHCGQYHGNELADDLNLPPVSKTVPPIFKHNPETGGLNLSGKGNGTSWVEKVLGKAGKPYQPQASAPGTNGKQPCPDCGGYHD